MGKQEMGPVPLPNDGHWLHTSLHQLISVPFEYEFVDDLATQSETLHAQLGRIQKFRSCVIHESHEISCELYRLLLEWMLSFPTPVNLRRALASLLRTFHSRKNGQQPIFRCSAAETIAKEVLDSILTKQERPTWLNRVVSAKEFVTWSPEMVKTPHVAAFLVEEAQQEIIVTRNMDGMVEERDVVRAVEWSSLVETILARGDNQVDTSHLQTLRLGLWELLRDAPIPTDDLSSVAIAFARTCPNIDETLESLVDLPLLKKAALLQGLAAASPLTVCLETIQPQCHAIALSSTEPLIRTLALKGIRSIVSRISPDDDFGDNAALDRLQDTTLDLALQSWENPQCRRLAASVKGLFQELVRFMQNRKGGYFDGLLSRVLEMSRHRKGRYTALEILLPVVGPDQLLSRRPRLLDELIIGMTDRGHSTGPIADLWAKLLRRLLHNNKPKEENPTNEQWMDIWVPSVAKALIAPMEISRRRRLADFCIPRLLTSVVYDDDERRTLVFVRLLSALGAYRSVQSRNEPPSKERETGVDRVLFAELEIIRRCAAWVLSPNRCSDLLRTSIRQSLPPVRLRAALAHFCPHIRLFAFKCLETAGPVYDDSSPWATVQQELSFWLYALPLSTKTDDKEFRFSMFLCFVRFLDRFSLTEALVVLQHANDGDKSLVTFLGYVSNFLLGDLLEKVGYPGAPPPKGAFMLGLLEALIVFTCREHPLASSSKFLPKTSAVYRRRRSPIEENAMHIVRQELLDSEVFCALLAAIRSPWDNIRMTSFRMLRSLVELGKLHSLPLPQDINRSLAREQMEARAIALASSPRPRESDSGSLILAYLSISSESKAHALENLLDLFEERLSEMQSSLKGIASHDGPEVTGAIKLPLSHGIVRSIHLSLAGITRSEFGGERDVLNALFTRLLSTLFCALRISLSVVADVSAGHHLPGLNEATFSTDKIPFSVPINPGAIGANGIFQSVERRTKLEADQQTASQRIVVGSWLLTKETCQALSSLLSFEGYEVDVGDFNKAGTLLISTMTSLKHTGAAYAAHNALQEVSTECLKAGRDSRIRDLPQKWVGRLFQEVQAPESIRDSTLRRSQGYALAFVALFRSATLTNVAIDLHISQLLRLSFPDEVTFRRSAGTAYGDNLLSVNRDGMTWEIYPVPPNEYNLRSRIHALNTLRLIVQDAAISKETKPFLGVALVAATVGFTDLEWAIRNSAMMLFASAMLQAVDSDKNSLNTDSTGNTSVSAHELFRTYPQLPTFLERQLIDFVGKPGSSNPQLSGGLPPFLPILVMFARIHPIVNSGQESADAIRPFIPMLTDFAEHRIFSVRKAAARALRSTLSSGSDKLLSSFSGMVNRCLTVVKSHQVGKAPLVHPHWNRLHGALLIMKEIVTIPHIQDLVSLSLTNQISKELSLLLQSDKCLPPPPCVAIASEVLSLLPVDILDTQLRLLQVVEAQRDVALGHQWGAPALGYVLGATLATELCFDIRDQLQKSFCDPVKFVEAVGRLSSVISSTCIDIRIPAVKQLKKQIYSIVDTMREHSDNSPGVFDVLGNALHRATINEVQNTGMKHLPCVRRLSRCFLEYVDMFGSESLLGGGSQCFYLAEEILSLLAFRTRVLPDFCIPPTVGNAVELLSAGISSIVSDEGHTSKLYDAIDRLHRQSCHWKLRFSAAIAVRNCCARTTLTSDDDMSGRLLSFAMVLLEDEDIDVRLACSQAVSALLPAKPLAQKWNEIPERSYFTILQILGERGHQQTGPSLSLLTNEDFLSLLSETERLVHNVAVPDEKSFSGVENHVEDPNQPIFEEELANEYQEVMMQGDVYYFWLLLGSKYLLPDDKISVVNRAVKVLNHLKLSLEQHRDDKSDHISRRPSVFPRLYTLLLICNAVLSMSLNETDESYRCLRRIVSSIVDLDSNLHKRIRFLLKSMETSYPAALTVFLSYPAETKCIVSNDA